MLADRYAQNPWWVVFATLLGLVVGQGTIELFCFSVFLKPLGDGLGLSRGTLSSALLMASLAAAVATPFAGALIDRYGSRAIMLPGIAAFAIAVMARSALPGSSAAAVYVLFLLGGLCSAVQTPIIYAAIVCRWFDQQRGLALGVAMAGTGVGAFIIPQMIAAVINNHGWRVAYVVLGGLILIGALLPVALFIRDPARKDAAPIGRQANASTLEWTFRRAVSRSWRFWLLSLTFLVGSTCLFGTFVHAVAILTDRGVGPQAAAAALSMAGMSMVAGRIATGYGLDRVHGPSVAILSFLVPAAGIAMLASGMNASIPFLAVVLCGFGQGAQVGLQPYFASRYFGLKSLGSISGAMFSLFLVGTGLGPFVSGTCFDRWHSYTPALAGYAAALALMSFSFAVLGPQPFAAKPRPLSQLQPTAVAVET